MNRITAEMIEEAMPAVAKSAPPMSDEQLLKAAQILRESMQQRLAS
jgi:hypothetical protein